MDKLLEIALWILVPIVVLLVICGTSIVVALFSFIFWGGTLRINVKEVKWNETVL